MPFDVKSDVPGMHVEPHENSYVLYSKGQLLDGCDYFASLDKLSKITHRTKQQIEERLLNGKKGRLKSSGCLKTILKLESRFKEAGLDVFIEIQTFVFNNEPIEHADATLAQ